MTRGVDNFFGNFPAIALAAWRTGAGSRVKRSDELF
jgi:hypothetical protein